MINKPKNWDDVSAFSDRKKLPVGAYECKIIQAKACNFPYGDQLVILFDITEGEFAGYYQADYDSNNRDDKKWKGQLRLWIPTDDGSENDERTKSTLKGFTTAVENSNPGYKWNWNENSLKGKEIGILYRNEEYDFEGRNGWTARPFKAISINAVVDGNYTIPKDKPLKNKTVPDVFVEELAGDDGSLPF